MAGPLTEAMKREAVLRRITWIWALDGGDEEGGRLAPDHLDIVVLGGAEAVGQFHLDDFALRQLLKGLRIDAQHLHGTAVGDEQVNGPGQPVVPHQQGCSGGKQLADRHAAAALVAVVHHVVVKKGGGVDKFGDSCAGYSLLINRTAAGLRGYEGQQRSEFFTRSIEEIGVDPVEKVAAGSQGIRKELFEAFPLRGYRPSDVFGQCHFCLLEEKCQGKLASAEFGV